MSPREGEDAHGNSLVGAAIRVWRSTYASDYIGLAGLLTGYIILVYFVEPFHRLFFINDLRIMFPHAEIERVSVPMNFAYALFTPLGVLIVWLSVTRASAHKHHIAYLAFFTSLILSSFLTDLIKNAVGRPRPDLIARCKPSGDAQPNLLVSIDICTETNHHLLHDGWRSFPSGHSSFSFSGLGYLALFFAGQLGVFKHGGGDLGRSLVCLLPLLGALLIAISRCEDYRHDVYDVSVGSALGFSVAYWSYHRFWPRLRSRDCHEPLAPPAVEMDGYGRVGDEEEGGVPRNGSVITPD